MKKALVITLLFFVATIAPSFAADTNSTATYKVTLSIVYNAVSAEEAAKIAGDSLKLHDKACKNNVRIDKNAAPATVFYSTVDTGEYAIAE